MAIPKITSVKNITLGIQSGTTNTVYATWEWSVKSAYSKHFDHYDVTWTYFVDGIPFTQSASSSKTKSATFSPQNNATHVKVTIQPVAKTHSVKKKTGEKDSKGKEKTKSVTQVYWTASKASKTLALPSALRIDTPSAPDIELNKTGLKMSITYNNTGNSNPTRIQFEVVKITQDSGGRDIQAASGTFMQQMDGYHFASYTMTNIDPGASYKVRCRAVVVKEVTITQGTGKYETVLVDVANPAVDSTSNDYLVSKIRNETNAKKKAILETELMQRVNSQNEYTSQTSKKYVTREITTSRKDIKPVAYSEWSDFAQAVDSYPGGISSAAVNALTSSSVRVSWTAALGAKGYEIWWVKDDPNYFDTAPSEINKSDADLDNPTCERVLLNLDNVGGPTYYFKVRGVNDEGAGGWSPIVSCRLATVPDAPTTWSYITTAVIGDEIDLNWTHNSEDGAAQEAAKIILIVNQVERPEITITGEVFTYMLSTSDLNLSDGDVVQWKVRTKGIPSTYSPWSTTRQVTVYAPASVDISLRGNFKWLWDTFEFAVDTIYTAKGEATEDITTVESFPFGIVATGYPATQSVISLNLSITANESYETIDPAGNSVMVRAGESVYSEYFSPEENTVSKRMTPGDIDLEDGMTYTLRASVAMNTGLSASASLEFDVSWIDPLYEPNALVTIDGTDLSCLIRPYCINDEGEEELNALLSVYRREYDGTFKLIAGGLEASDKTSVSDPHPALDYARYRIVAQSKTTGGISYQDLEGVPIGYSAVVITWDEVWRNYNDLEGTGEEIIDMEEGGVNGSMLMLPYNIDVNADYSPSVELVEYIGREHPVSYYGTQKGETAKWSVEIPKDDAETIYQIRRLAVYPGDVYVREPSGTGYWAQVKVSYQITHSKVSVPVTLQITRVEGGV